MVLLLFCDLFLLFPCISEKYGNGQAEDGGQFPHKVKSDRKCGEWGVWVDFPVKTLTGHGENSIHRRYETPQMHVSLTLYSDCPIDPKQTPQHGV